MSSSMRHGTGFWGIAALAVALATPAQAQVQDARWLAFIGCWEPVDAGEEAGLLCFSPSGDGVEMTNIVSGEVTASERLVADGQARPVTADECTGTESIVFSDDGQRAFTSSELSCEGQPRSGTGVMSFIAPAQWIDVRSLDIDGEQVAWVQRYALATQDALEEHGADDPAASTRTTIRAARIRAVRDIEVADVEEAAEFVDARALEVWVATHGTPFELSGDELVRLADAGISESVIDVMVAVSYPSRFVLTPEGAASEAVAQGRLPDDGYRGYRGYRGFRSFLWDPLYYDPFYAPFGYRYGRYGFSPFGLYGYGYGGFYGYRPTTVVIQPREPARGGRMVRGIGYTRGGVGAGSGSARPSYGRTGRSGASAGSSSRGGGGGGGARSSGGSGRTAQPRGGR